MSPVEPMTFRQRWLVMLTAILLWLCLFAFVKSNPEPGIATRQQARKGSK